MTRTSLFVAAASLLVTVPGLAQDPGSAKVVPLQVNGDPAARFSMVVLGDGYTAEEMPKFRAQVEKHLNVLWSIEPFRSYRTYINVYAVEIVSAESGITCDPEIRLPRRTPLKMEFSGGCSNPNARGIMVDRDAAQAYAARATPHYDQVLVLANTDTYGGIGGAMATTSGGNSLGPLITPHELGHSLGRLQDEYTYSARGKPGGPYAGEEPPSVHMTLLTEQQMRAQGKKWWRWLDDPSESGGRIGRFEGGMQRTTGVWRPSRHSMMISVGYYFDQVSRERMTQRISEQVSLIVASTPEPSARPGVPIWIETAQPVYHELDVTWEVDGTPIAAARNQRFLELTRLGLAAAKTVKVTVVDPTEFVRDPEIRAKALTATRRWQVAGVSKGDTEVAFPGVFRAYTPTDRQIGKEDVVYVAGWYPIDEEHSVHTVTWRLNGTVVADAANRRTFALGPRQLPPGRHTLSAGAADPSVPSRPPHTLTWTIDATPPSVNYNVSQPAAQIRGEGSTAHYLMRDAFTMALDPADDGPGYVVAEFRVNVDGWHHYYGWPDAPPGTPFKFTPRGTTIKELIYGSLSSEGLSPQPWEAREPGWGTHRIEYRGIDAAGNIGAPKAFRVTLLPAPACTTTISAPHAGDLRVDGGVTCVTGTRVQGSVTVAAGASLVAVDATIGGTITAVRAHTIELVATAVEGSVSVDETTGAVTLFGANVEGALSLTGSRTSRPGLVTGTRVKGAVSCTGNGAPPENGGTPNTFERGATGQCSGR